MEVMHQYGLLLEDFENNGKFTNDCIFTMMHHIGGDIDHVATLFQPNILKTFSKIWESDYEICDDWSDLIEYVIHQFINVPRQLPQRSPSPKLTEPVAEIEVYRPLSPLLEENNNEWNEEDIDALYWHYIQSRKCENVVENIEKLYIENGVTNKTREGIIRELFSQNMITQTCYEEFLKLEDINPDQQSKVTQEDQESRDIQALKEQLVRENKGNAILWLQRLLLEACHCKVIINNNDSCADAEIYEPVPYCYIKLRQSIPVVPWCQEHSNVLKNKSLLSLLYKLGFQLPCDSRKMFVRIPHSWTAKHMYHLAQKLGPLHPANLKFDVSLLKAEDATVTPPKDERLYCETRFRFHEEEQEEQASTSGAKSQYLLANLSSNLFQTVLHSKLNAVLHFTHNAQSRASALPTDQCHEEFVQGAAMPSADIVLTHEGSEHYSICKTISVTSDLTRMYVSDEEDKD